MSNVNVSVKNVMFGNRLVWNPATCSCEDGKCLASIVDDSAIMCDEVLEPYVRKTKTIPTNFIEKNQPLKLKRCLFHLHFFQLL